jgi:hypothetical protein
MKLHPRTLPVERASAAICGDLNQLQEAHGLTDVEMLRILLDHQQTVTKRLLRGERHPDDPDRNADEE